MDIKELITNNINTAVAASIKEVSASIEARTDKSVEKIAKAAIDLAIEQMKDDLDARVREIVARVMSEAFGTTLSVPDMPRKRKGTRKWTPEQIEKRKETLRQKKAALAASSPSPSPAPIATPMPQAVIDANDADISMVDLDPDA